MQPPVDASQRPTSHPQVWAAAIGAVSTVAVALIGAWSLGIRPQDKQVCGIRERDMLHLLEQLVEVQSARAEAKIETSLEYSGRLSEQQRAYNLLEAQLNSLRDKWGRDERLSLKDFIPDRLPASDGYPGASAQLPPEMEAQFKAERAFQTTLSKLYALCPK